MSDFITTTTINSESLLTEGISTCKDVVTTTFVDDGEVVCGDYSHASKSDDFAIRDQSITDFLRKPYFVGTYSWSTADTEGTLITFGAIASKLSAALWTTKLEGYNLVRGTFVMRIMLNANPFQQGKLLLHLLPCETNFTAVDASYVALHNANLATQRMQPSLEIDCRDTTAIFTIPYVTPMNWYSRDNLGFDWGTYYLHVLSPLLTGAGGTTTVSISVYIHFEDFELAAPLVPQSNPARRKYSAKTFSKGAPEDAESKAPTLSSLLATGSSIAKGVSSIPLLSAIATPATWALNLASTAASAFGWSKPRTDTLPHPVYKISDKFAGTADGNHNYFPLTISGTNRLSTMCTNSLTDEDEMSFAFLKRVKTLIDPAYSSEVTTVFNKAWNTSDAAGTVLMTKKIGPGTIIASGETISGANTIEWRTGPPLWYMSRDFALWRGSFDIVIKFAKTEFHTGRLLVTWTPTTDQTVVSPTITTSVLALKEIIDVTSGSEFHFTLPYLVDSNYLAVNESGALYKTTSGVLDIVVLTVLCRPETAASKINMMIYASGGADFEYQAPSFLTNDTGSNVVPFSPQMGVTLVDEVIGGQSSVSMSTKYAEQSIGEAFLSIKQLLSRNTLITSNIAVANTQWELWPWFSGITKAVAGVITAPPLGGDVYSKYSNMYAFYRGGVRLKAINASTTSSQMYLRNISAIGDFAITPLLAGTVPTNTATVLWQTTAQILGGVSASNSECGTNFQLMMIPYMSMAKCSLKLNQTSATAQVTLDSSQSFNVAGFTLPGSTGTGFPMQRAFADDFQLSYFIGCPPLKYNIHVT